MQVLVLEASTTSAKAMVYDGEKGVLNTISVPYPAGVNVVSEQSAQGVMDHLLTVGSKAAAGYHIGAVTLSGTWHSLMLTDADMNPITMNMTWAYMEGAAIASEIRKDQALTHKLYHKTGCMVHAMYPAYKLKYVKQKQTLPQDFRITFQSDYIFYRLTGDWSVSRSIASGTALLNTHKLEWDDEILAQNNISPFQLPLVRPHTYTAPLLGSAAEKLGLKKGIPVAVANSDGSLNQIGAGALKPGIMTLSVGTSCAIRMAFDRPVIPEKPSTWCYYAPGKWLSGAATNGGTSCVDWFMKHLSAGKSFAEMEALMPVNSLDYPVFLPFIYGERCPGWRDDRLGSFQGMKGSHGAGHMYLAVLEGILFNLYHCYKILTSVGGTPTAVRVSGGILNSPFWTSMLSDILQREISCPNMKEASMMGAAAIGLHILGQLENLEDFDVDKGKVYSPNPKMENFYNNRFDAYLNYYDKDSAVLPNAK
jgi:gluconokinase